MVKAIPGGIGAIGSAFMKFVKPGQPLQDKFGEDNVKKYRLENCVITGKSVRRLRARGKEVPAYSIRHDDFPGEEFHVAKSNFKVELSCTLDSDIFEDELPGQQPQRRERASAARPQNRVGTNSVVPENQQEHEAT